MSGGILPLFTNVNPTPLWGSGGGGGGSNNPNPQVSTITFPSGGILNMSQILFIQDPITGSLNDFYFQTGINANNIVSGGVFSPGGQANVLSFTNPGAGQTYLNIGTTDQGGAIIAAVKAGTGAASTLTIAADVCYLPQNIVVDNINGAPYTGGFVGPNLVVSSLTAAQTISTATLNMENYVAPGQYPFRIRANSGAMLIEDVAGNEGVLQTSSLTVSSINGAVYPPPTPPIGIVASSVGLSNFAGDVAYIPGGNVAYPLSATFPITAGHTYRISANLTLNNGEQNGNSVLAVVGGGAGFPAFIASFDNQLLIVGNNGLAGGYQTVFLASANATAQVVGYNTAAIASTIVQAQSASAKWVLEDLGTI